MSQNNKEQEALDAYLHLLAGKGAGSQALQQRLQVVSQLIPLLQRMPGNDNLYRDAVEAMMLDADKSVWPIFLNVVREYYHFWVNDIKMIAAMHAGDGFDIAPIAIAAEEGNLKALWARLDGEAFGVSEKWTLKAYSAALREEGADKSVVETRCNLVKLLLLRLRGLTEKNARSYRTAVNATLPLFDLRETRLLFLIVVREFFYFWIGDPEAPSHIILDAMQE